VGRLAPQACAVFESACTPDGWEAPRTRLGSRPHQYVAAQTKASVASELIAMAAAEGGAGASVIPAAVKIRVRRVRATSANDLARVSAVPEMNSQSPPMTIEASRLSAARMWFHKPAPTEREAGPRSGSSGRWTIASRAQWESTAAATSAATRHFPSTDE